MLRVISGIYRHRMLKQPKSELIRPTMDRVKEAIFSSIRFNLEEKIVLDLFSGSGSMAIEAISNYAANAVAVDNNKDAINTIKANMKDLGIKNISLYYEDSISFLETRCQKMFDYIFVDPPYKQFELLNKSLALIKQNNFLWAHGELIVETSDPNRIIVPKGMEITKTKKYGRKFVVYISHIL